MNVMFVYIFVTVIQICLIQFKFFQSLWQTKITIYANSVDPDEMASNEPSHQALQFAILFLILD